MMPWASSSAAHTMRGPARACGGERGTQRLRRTPDRAQMRAISASAAGTARRGGGYWGCGRAHSRGKGAARAEAPAGCPSGGPWARFLRLSARG